MVWQSQVQCIAVKNIIEKNGEWPKLNCRCQVYHIRVKKKRNKTIVLLYKKKFTFPYRLSLRWWPNGWLRIDIFLGRISRKNANHFLRHLYISNLFFRLYLVFVWGSCKSWKALLLFLKQNKDGKTWKNNP
jgi:hypothetical protein